MNYNLELHGFIKALSLFKILSVDAWVDVHLDVQEELHADFISVRDLQRATLRRSSLPSTPLLQPPQRGLRLPDLYDSNYRIY